MEEKEFLEGKILITNVEEYDAIYFKDETYEEKICSFIKDHNGIIKQRDISYDPDFINQKIRDEVIHFEYYGFGDYPERYSISIGLWLLVPKDNSENKFIVMNSLPNCIKVKGEIY